MTILSVNTLTKKFGGLTAVSDVDFEVQPGEILGIIGPNGAGKTTLFNMLAGSMQPTSGTVHLKGQNITGMRADRIARLGVARTFQITSLFPALSAHDNVRAATYRTKKTGWMASILRTATYRAEEADVDRDAMAALHFCDLAGHADDNAESLSYGDQRRLEIAIALAAKPALLLLDEPAAGMNPEEGQRLVNMIRKIRDNGTSVLLVEHHMRVVMGVCDRVVVLDHGEKIAEGTPAAVVDNPDVIRVYLGREAVSA
ncbi:MAG: ABC transporter ATP-binding protein [Roseitalea sp.]|jgi:branched-chain amino acid transport system ATP-binding protein|uniref:ABC transporter ATP-binding protein n=1 Tax=Oceaniradius stylonematis TaxID=2184161 RepID=UPI000F3DE97E|nr:ABC transporter ATP-binding protein [Roseitalea sp.]MBO6951028.1 ABC transporter ATP-binding protein [Rhizobiaceae bacterium]RNC93942.1 MAG: ABC transporter ATP-binding protein [Oricola sp.]MBO6590985.1 ABC transporter ATP-binding protein [Roseitalea sp.]MBO6599757.1 ABC transporter ATP-binding protein [Roseitalea sp.]